MKEIFVDRFIYQGLRYVSSRCAASTPDREGEGPRLRLNRGMDATAGSLITAFDYAWARLTGRLTG